MNIVLFVGENNSVSIVENERGYRGPLEALVRLRESTKPERLSLHIVEDYDNVYIRRIRFQVFYVIREVCS